jgi:biotin transporter BioY
VIYGPGLLVLSAWVPAAHLLHVGLLPFLAGEAVKMLLAAIIILKSR